MSFTDFLLQFDRVATNKIFSENWEVYSIESQWTTKTNGGRCPAALDKGTETKEGFKNDHLQPESDDRWFNNPQFRIKIHKDTKIYISLMLEDESLSGQPYVPCGYMLAASKSKSERFW
jgi:calpain, invertebrate